MKSRNLFLRIPVLGLSLLMLLNLISTKLWAEAPMVCLVHFQRALNEVEAGKRAKNDLKKRFESEQKALEKQQEQLKNLQEELQAKSAALSQSALRQKEQEYRQKFIELQKNLNKSRQELATQEANVTQKIITQLKEISEQIGKEKNCDLVIESSQDTVLYSKKSQDLTNEVIKKHNSKR